MPAVTWLTDSEWSALWSQIRPNLRSVEEFRDLVMAGRLDIYKRDEMDKVVRFLKQLLKGKGRLKDAEAGGKGVMTKSQLASHVAKLVEADAAETQEEEAELLQQPRRRQPRRDEDATTPTEATVPPSPPQPARTRILSTAALSPAQPPGPGATHVVKPLESPRGSKTHHHGSFSLPVPAPLPPTAPLPRVLRFPPWHGPIPSKPQPVTAFEPHQSPLNPVDSCIARIPLRMGNVSRPIELTPANMAKLNDRTHRLVLFPVEGITFLPSAWPASKDVAITVNRQPYAATWKRNWPAKKMDMKRTYLMADITALVTKHKSTQTISLDCFARDYYANIVVALVGSVPENVVAGAIRDKPGYRAYVAHEALKKIYTDALIQPAGDRDVEIDASTVTVVDPISRGIIMIPVRGSRCEHLQCVDLQSFLRSCHIQCYWNCPICDRVMHVDEIVIDPYMSTALSNPAITSDTQLQVSLDSAVSVGFRWTIAIAPPSVVPASSLLQRKPPSSLPLTELSDSDGSESNVPQYVYYGGRKVLRESRRKNAGTSDAPIEID